VFAGVVISWTSLTIKQRDLLQAFELLKLLSHLVKKRRKLLLADRQSFFSQLCLLFAYFYLKDRKYNAALDCVAKGIAAEEKAKTSEWRAHLHSLAGFASSQAGDHRKAVAAYQQALRHLASTEFSLQAALYYNLAISLCNMHLRSDALPYIQQAAGLAAQAPHSSQVHPKIVNLFRELTGAVPVGISQPPSTTFNFMPGGVALDQSSKYVEVRMESHPSRRNKSRGDRNKQRSSQEPVEELKGHVDPRPETTASREDSSIKSASLLRRDDLVQEGGKRRDSKKRLTTELIIKQDGSKAGRESLEEGSLTRSRETGGQDSSSKLSLESRSRDEVLLSHSSKPDIAREDRGDSFKEGGGFDGPQVDSVTGDSARPQVGSFDEEDLTRPQVESVKEDEPRVDSSEDDLAALQIKTSDGLKEDLAIPHSDSSNEDESQEHSDSSEDDQAEHQIKASNEAGAQLQVDDIVTPLSNVSQSSYYRQLLPIPSSTSLQMESNSQMTAVSQSAEFAVFRQCITKSDYLKTERSILTIQQAWRQRRSLLHKHRLAYVLQRAIRGRLVRLDFKRQEELQLTEAAESARVYQEFYEKNKSQVAFIQRVWKGSASRRTIEREGRAVQKLQRWLRSHVLSKLY
jgi:tetratricopeptide (TPR) repeat protein